MRIVGYINTKKQYKYQQNAHLLHYQAHPAIYQTAYMDARKKYHKTGCKSLPEDERLDVRNVSKTL